MEDTCGFCGVLCTDPFWHQLPGSGEKNTGEEDTFLEGRLCPGFPWKVGREGLLVLLLFLKYLQLKTFTTSERHIWGGRF